MTRLQSVLCASALAIALAPTVLAGNIHGVSANGNIHGVSANGNIHGVSANGNITTLQPVDITGKPGDITGLLTWGDITGVIAAILGNIHG